ncbi:MAG TPA: CsbD family protein [Stellaceae bacterium]|nr:CsbD family protein [Stellaceae bacterium]
MDKDRIAGSIKQLKGSIKVAIGGAVGDAKLQVDGEADKAEGKIQNIAGAIKDSVKP